MKTTLTLEDVERLERKIRLSEAGSVGSYIDVRDEIYSLLPLILPVIREHVGNPEGLRPPEQASLDQGTDAPPVEQKFGRSPQEWLEKYLDTDNTWLLTAYHNDQVVHRVLKHCANLGKSVPFMYQFLAHNLFIAYKEWFDLGIKQAELGPIYSSGGTSAHPGSHPVCTESKAQASQKTAQEGSVCEVEPLGEVHRNLAGFTYIVLNPVDGDQWMLEAQGDCIGFGPVMSLNYFYRNHVSSLVSHLTAWLHTGSFDLKGLPSSPPSSEDTELLDWLEESKCDIHSWVNPTEWQISTSQGMREFSATGNHFKTLRAAIRAARAKEAQASTTQKGGQGV